MGQTRETLKARRAREAREADLERRMEEATRELDRRIRERAAGRVGLGPDEARGHVYAPAGTSGETLRELLRLYLRFATGSGQGRDQAWAALERRGCTYWSRSR